MLAEYVTAGPHQGLMGRQSAVDSALVSRARRKRIEDEALRDAASGPRTGDILAEYVLFRRVRRLMTRWVVPEVPPVPDFDLTRFAETMTAAKAATDAHGSSLSFVYLPDFFRYAVGRPHPEKGDVMRTVRGLDIPVVDVDSLFSAGDPLAYFPNRMFGHYNADGYALVAEAILRLLRE